MLTVNLFDHEFAHLTKPDGLYSMVGHPNSHKQSKYIRYVRNRMNWEGITIFTDRFLCRPDIIRQVNSKYKIGWYIEATAPNDNFESYINDVDFVMTNHNGLLKKYPNKTKFIPFGGGWILEENQKISEKSKLISIIYSNKRTFEGHILRHKIVKNIDGVDLYGNGSPTPIDFKEHGLSDYMFSIIVEQVKTEGYFTEKLIDSFLTGTVPIYWGCPNIDSFFDTNGMIIFNTVDELKDIINNLTEDSYREKLESVKKNFKLAKDYEVPENWIYKNIIEGGIYE